MLKRVHGVFIQSLHYFGQYVIVAWANTACVVERYKLL